MHRRESFTVADRTGRIHAHVSGGLASRLRAYSYCVETNIEIRVTESGRMDGAACAVDAVDRNLR